MEALRMLSCMKVHRFPLRSWMMGENRRSGLSRHGFSQASLHRARLCRPVPSHTANTNIATIPWSSKECCLNFLTSVVPSWAPRFPSSEGPYCMARLSFITSMALKESVGEGRVGGWKSEPKLINWSFSRKCRQENIGKLKRTNSSTVTKQGWGKTEAEKEQWEHTTCYPNTSTVLTSVVGLVRQRDGHVQLHSCYSVFSVYN